MGKTRLEAFSDAVLAIVITIIVLDLKTPHGRDGEFRRGVARVARPALSRQTCDLEAEIGVASFDRSGRGVRLSTPARVLSDLVRRILAELEQASAEVQRVARVIAVVPAGRQLARRRRIRLAELALEPFVSLPRDSDATPALCAGYRFDVVERIGGR